MFSKPPNYRGVGGGTSYIWLTACAAPKGGLFKHSKITVRVSQILKSLVYFRLICYCKYIFPSNFLVCGIFGF